MFEKLTEGLANVFNYITGQTHITEYNIATTVKELRRALISADVHYKIAKEFTEEVKKKALEMAVVKNVTPGQMFIKITYEELVKLLGGTTATLTLKGKPAVVMLVGLQGSGKTTFAVKLGYYLRNKMSKSPLIVACDVYRPAAIDQLKQMAQQENLVVYDEGTESKPVKIAMDAVGYARLHGFDVVIIDTAGRQVVDEDMMKEVEEIKSAVVPAEVLLVVDSMIGQEAVNIASVFHQRLGLTGVVLTKMDGDARGGAALSIKYATGVPIKFISTGERTFQIEVFHPDRMASRIMGMGDVVSFVEKAEEMQMAQKIRETIKKAKKNKFTMNDLLEQFKMMKDVDRLREMISLLPAIGKHLPEISEDDIKYIKRLEAVIYSMTPEERENPSIINFSRKMRIAKGSGTSIDEVNTVLRLYEGMMKIMKNIIKMITKMILNEI